MTKKRFTKKKKSENEPRQQRIPGTVDKATLAIEGKAEEYCAILYSRMFAQEQENVARAELIKLMTNADIREFVAGGYKIKLTLSEKEKLTVKKEGD